MAIYSKAQEILWNEPTDLHGKVTMNMGDMHFTMAFIAAINNIFGEGGLTHILIESGVYA